MSVSPSDGNIPTFKSFQFDGSIPVADTRISRLDSMSPRSLRRTDSTATTPEHTTDWDIAVVVQIHEEHTSQYYLKWFYF